MNYPTSGARRPYTGPKRMQNIPRPGRRRRVNAPLIGSRRGGRNVFRPR